MTVRSAAAASGGLTTPAAARLGTGTMWTKPTSPSAARPSNRQSRQEHGAMEWGRLPLERRGGMQLMHHVWDAAVAVDPAVFDLDEVRRFPICKPEPLAELFKNAGLSSVETRAIDVPTIVTDFDDHWSPFLGGQAPAPGQCGALSQPDRCQKVVPRPASGRCAATGSPP